MNKFSFPEVLRVQREKMDFLRLLCSENATSQKLPGGRNDTRGKQGDQEKMCVQRHKNVLWKCG